MHAGGRPTVERRDELTHPVNGTRVEVDVVLRSVDPVSQVFSETWRFRELDGDALVREEHEVLRLRWTYRQEMRYLLELCGFEVVAEYSAFDRSPPRYGDELLFVARAAVSPTP